MQDTTVFTNGCFDILHAGHIDLLDRARALGSHLVVGINSDESVRAIKGPGRPIVGQEDRKAVLLGLRSVDEVIIYDELTPEKLIKQIKPDVLVKGGDWLVNEIVGGSFVSARGGRVMSLPLKPGYSTSRILQKIGGRIDSSQHSLQTPVGDKIGDLIQVLKDLKDHETSSIERCGKLICSALKQGGKVLLCGNGGSAADAQHIAAELVGRFEKERRALPAIALTTDTSALTAISNDYAFERVYARQVEALAKRGDCLIAISTSGSSPNILAAAAVARDLGCTVIGMTGTAGKKLAGLSDACLLVPSSRTSHIQEAHIAVAHIWCEMVDQAMDPA